jgi:hypothetical protein
MEAYSAASALLTRLVVEVVAVDAAIGKPK